jgi:hypothetical protein
MTPRRTPFIDRITVVIASASGVAAAVAPPAPTGRPFFDAVVVGLAVAGVAWVAAVAPWWALAVAGGAALIAGVHPILIVLGAVALAAAIWVRIADRDVPEVRAAVAGLSLNVLAWAQLEGFFGLSSLIGLGVAGLLFVTGIKRRPAVVRRRAWMVVGGAGAIAALAAIGFALAAVGARSELSRGSRLVNQGISALNEGDFAGASDDLAAAATALHDAEDALDQPWGIGAAIVPVVAQHRDAALELSAGGAEQLVRVASALDEIDPDSLSVAGGRIDLDAISALAGPFSRIDEALDRMAVAGASADSPWLIPMIGNEVDALNEDIARNAPRIDNAVRAVELAPEMLGGDDPAVYLILFTTPAEARGLGGFIGNYAELTITDGKLDLTDFGRPRDFELEAVEAGARLDGPRGFLSRYGRFGFDVDGNGLLGDVSFRNVTMTPHFPWVGEVAREVYAQVTGTEVDGVVVMDPYVVAALLKYAGPITLTEYDVELDHENAAHYLLEEQYLLGQDDRGGRVEALEEAARLATDALLTGSLPEPTQLARDLGPLAADRRLLVWAADAEQQDLLQRVGLLGEIPSLNGGDGWSVAITNGSASKIDVFLERSASYSSSTDGETGITTGSLRVELTNTAPASGLPRYVIGNEVGLPLGTSRLYVSAYSALGLTGALVNGQPSTPQAEQEAGWNVYSQFVDIPPGGTVVLEYSLEGTVRDPERIVTWTQPMAHPLVVEPPAGDN